MSWFSGIRGRVTLAVLVVATCLYSLLGAVGFLRIADTSRDAIRDRIGDVLDDLEAQLRAGGSTFVVTTPDGVQAIATAPGSADDEARGQLVETRSLKIGPTELELVGRADDTRVSDNLRSLHRVLWIGIGVASLATAALAGMATGRALRPVAEMTNLAATIGPRDDDTRVPVPDSDDEVASLATTINAMLDRIAAGRAAQRQFTSDAAHELRTPLMALQGELELAGRGGLDAELLPRLAALAERLGHRVDDLVLLSSLDETPPLRRAECDLAELVGHEAALVDPAIAVSDGSVMATIDEALVGRAVRNLVANARRHARERVEVSVRHEGDDVVVDVDDDGPGIAEADRDRVFDRFARLDDARGSDRGGSGLGLAIVASVARAHGGTAAATESPLGGARVTLRLPAADQARAAAIGSASASSSARSAPDNAS